jgi:hypothetical protein
MIIVNVKCLIIISKRQLFLLFTHLNTQYFSSLHSYIMVLNAATHEIF